MTVDKGGRPRIHDRDQIALDMIEWAKLPDSINLNKFCCTREPPLAPSMITNWARECERFKRAYETAKAFLGARREEWLAEERLHVKAYDLNANTYDHFLKDERRAEKEYEASLKVEKSDQPTKIIFEVNNGTGNQIEILPKTLPDSSTPSSE
jgi:hypothetical protein